MLSDFKFALRQLLKSPSFTAVAVLALALGIGANTAIFSIINSIFLRPLPYPQPERLVRLTSSQPERNINQFDFSYTRYLAVRDAQTVFSSLAYSIGTGFTVTGRGDPEQVQGIMASTDYLPTLGVQPAYGRNFSADEDRAGGPPVVMLSHHFWTTHYNSNPAALGQTLTMDGLPHTIIGVLPPALSEFPFNQTELWTPRPSEVPFIVPKQLYHGGYFFRVIARLKPGVTLTQARENLKVIAANYRGAMSSNTDAPTSAEVDPLLDTFVGNQRPTYAMLFGAVGCVLLIACANVANLLLARFTSRRKEIALRFALGASRTQVVRQLLAESLLIALSGAALGVLFARWGLDTFVHVGQDFIPRALDIALDRRALLFTGGIALLTGLGMGLFPALSAAQQDANDALKESSRGSSAGAVTGRLRSTLLIGEIALSFVLLIAASLLLTSFARLQQVAPGFQPNGVFVGFLNVPANKYPGQPALANFYSRLIDRLTVLPGAKAVALNDSPPLAGNNGPAPVAVIGRAIPPLSERPMALRHLVTPGSFSTLGIRLESGRDFTARDRPDTPATVIVNQSFARRHFPGKDPIGRKLVTGMGEKIAEIVGVVADTRSTNLNAAPEPEYYLPMLQRPENFISIMIRTGGDPAAFAAPVRAALREVDRDLPLLNPQSYPTMIAQSVADRRLVMMLLAAFAGLALVLACLGVYSVMAYVVTQRTSEIGIRMALGANPAEVQRMILGQGLRLTLIGIGVGLVAALLLTRLMAQLLFSVQAHDPLIYAGIAALLCAVATCACWLPARRATRVDPIIALRAE
jgi:predicted permease